MQGYDRDRPSRMNWRTSFALAIYEMPHKPVYIAALGL